MAEQFDPNKEHENCGTIECCNQCDTAHNPKDWYIVGFSPWYRITYNPKTKQCKRDPIEWLNQQNT